MLLLVSGATATVRRHLGHPALGRFTQPRCGNDVAELATCGAPYAVDNDALQGVDPDALIALWDEIAAAQRLPGARPPLFVPPPDAVEKLADRTIRGSWEGTLWLFRAWLPALRARGLPPAIVLQDGATLDTVPWADIRAVFVGGSDAWKLGRSAVQIVHAARARGLWAHVGRVNSFKRLALVEAMGASSFDGGQFSMFPDTYIPRYLRRLERKQHSIKEITLWAA